MKFYPLIIFLCLGVILLSSCRDSDKKGEGYDPNRPVVFNSFSPSEGSIRTKLFIKGDNFGFDPSKIRVSIGGIDAKVIGANGKEILCMIPGKAYKGDVKISLLNEQDEVSYEYTFDDAFNYISKMTVGTLAGKIDPASNTSSLIDGIYSEAEFINPYWLVFHKDEEGRKLYLVEVDQALREINLDEEYVSTIVTNGQAGLNKVQTVTMDITGDTIFLVDDNGQNNNSRPVLTYSVRSEGFKRVYPYIFDRTGYSCAQHPDGTLFYNTLWSAAVMKVRGKFDTKTQEWVSKPMFNVANVNGHTYMTMHPDGKYVYITGANYCSVYKSKYDPVKKELEPPVIFAGGLKSQGYVDAPGTQARFGNPMRQGVFVKNEEYVKAGAEDVYDFYVCDTQNNCIRKITPDAEVTTFAGRGTLTGNDANNAVGYIDGDPRLEARFNTPTAIAYDEDTGIFYIADNKNKRIRYIAFE